MSQPAKADSSMSQPAASVTPLLDDYRQRLTQGWQPDAAQAHAVARLEDLLLRLSANTAKAPKGLWLFGPPGRGKSQLLELFLAHVPHPAKRRVHFHAFMEELHRRLHVLPHTPGADPLQTLATQLAAEATVLGFDEFYLTNIADAMLLGRLMKLLFAQGVVVVATSNWPLPELFQGGLNRDRFLPFLKLMETHLEPLDLRHGPDWRQPPVPAALPVANPLPHYVVTPVGTAAGPRLLALFTEYAAGPDQPTLTAWRPRRQQGRAVWLGFEEACDTPRSRTEYARLAAAFDTVLIEGIPLLGPSDADATLRLTTLIDILYEQRRRLIISAAASPGELCLPGNPASQVFQRTASRLHEMTRPTAAGPNRRPA